MSASKACMPFAIASSAEVIRKGSYKGGLVVVERSFPVDATTVMGMLGMIGCMCKAVTLGNETIGCLRVMLETLEEHMCVHQVVRTIPNKPKYNVDIVHSKVKLRNMKTVFEKLDLNYSRQDTRT